MRVTIAEDLPMSDCRHVRATARPAPEAQRRSPSARRASLDLQQRSRYAPDAPAKFKAGELVRCWRTMIGPGTGLCQSAVADRARMLETWKMPDAAWLTARIRDRAGACASACTRSPIIGWCTASPTGCRDWWWTAMGQPASCRSAPPAWSAETAHTRGLKQGSSAKPLLFKNDSAAREMEGLPSYVETAMGKFDKPAR